MVSAEGYGFLMKFEDIEIRIAKDGKVYVRLDGVSEDRIRSFREFLEDQIGPVHSVEIISKPDWDQPAERTSDESAGKKELEIDRNG